jgi:hypothetical protein
MKVREERILADRKLAKSGLLVDQLLSACWQECLDAGPYPFDAAVDWARVLQGDRFFTLLQIRIHSYGGDYVFDVSCKECRTRIEWELDLGELPVRSLSEESREAFLRGNRFEAVLPDAGRRVAFHLPTGSDERRIAVRRKHTDGSPISTVLSSRIDSIEAVDPRERARFIEDLTMSDVTFLLGEFDRVDCGVETDIEVECSECFGTQVVELPFDKSFFLPTRKKQGHGSSSRASTSNAGGRPSFSSAGSNTVEVD